MSQTKYTPKNRRLQYGEVSGDTYSKTVKGSRHMLRSPRSWAIDSADLAEAERQGATRVEIFDAETGLVYTATIATIRARGLAVNRGFGKQTALPLQHWGVIGDLVISGISAVKSDRQPQKRQLCLFEGVKP